MSTALEKRLLNPMPMKSTPLPVDYVRMVKEVFVNHFEALLKECAEKCNDEALACATFEIQGAIYTDEILFSVSLTEPSRVAATTVHTSAAFDPKASAPNAQDILGACVDAASELFTSILDPAAPAEKLGSLLNDSLGALIENAEIKSDDPAKKLITLPIEWTSVDVNRMKIFMRVDKSNLALDQQAEDWLEKNDPDYEARKIAEQKETEKLFVKGPKNPDELAAELDELAEDDDLENEDEESGDDSSSRSGSGKTFH